MLFRFFYLVLLSLPLLGSGKGFDHEHRLWGEIVSRFVHNSHVDYAGLAKEHGTLDAYLNQLDSVSRPEVDAWDIEKQLAFWINAYNAFTIQSILDHYPIKSWTIKGLLVPRNSIIQIPGVWKKLKWEVAGQNLTLDHIEHGLLRPVFREPRIHFAIVCASIGCPDLRSEAYTFDKLEQQLKDQTRRFLLNPEKGVRFDYEGRKICVSQLFRWFSEDFPGKEHATPEFGSRPVKERNILQFISGYLTDPEQQTLISDPEVDLDYLPYDWTLNELPASDVPA